MQPCDQTHIHRSLFPSISFPVREFLCFDDPPGPFDSLEESRVSVCVCLCVCVCVSVPPTDTLSAPLLAK